MLVEVNEPYKQLDLSHIPRHWPVSDAGNLDWVHLYMTFQEDETKVFDHRLFKGTLLCFKVETVLMEDIEDPHYNPVMLFFSLTAEDEDVIHVDGDSSLMISLKWSFIIVWKVVGLFVEPKNITRGSKRPWFNLKTAFHLSPSLICTLLYPQWMSSFVKYLALASETLLRMSGLRGRG